MSTEKQPWILLSLIWAVLTAIGVWISVSIGILPSPGSLEAHVIDSATTLMTALSVPIFMLVMTVLVYSLVRFRGNGDPELDGAPIEGNTGIQTAWVGISFLLVLFLIGYGAFGLNEIRAHAAHGPAAHNQQELNVQVTATRFSWEFVYPEQNVKTKQEIVLPMGRPVHFEIRSTDVLHSFWIPAFRTKIDAVPGLVTSVSATPDRVGAYADDVNYRMQCAELCGGGHGAMYVPVRVVEPAQFDQWVTANKGR